MLGGMAMAVGSMHMHTVFECSSSVAKVNLTTSMAFSSVEFVLYCLPTCNQECMHCFEFTGSSLLDHQNDLTLEQLSHFH